MNYLRLFLLLALTTAPVFGQGKSSVVNGLVKDGLELTCDLPGSQQFKNIGSKLDGSGMCVFSSIEMAALYQGLEDMRGWRDWCAKNYRGGGYPSKVDKLLADWWKHKSMKPLPYMQYEGRTPEKIMEMIDKTGRMASITYGYSPRYGSTIAHMVNSPMYRGQYGCVLDNNFVAKKQADGSYDENIIEWMTKEELVRRMKIGGGAWVFVWLDHAPPPPPKNLKGII